MSLKTLLFKVSNINSMTLLVFSSLISVTYCLKRTTFRTSYITFLPTNIIKNISLKYYNFLNYLLIEKLILIKKIHRENPPSIFLIPILNKTCLKSSKHQKIKTIPILKINYLNIKNSLSRPLIKSLQIKSILL